MVGRDEITIQLSGWNALPSLRRIVRIPLAAVRSIRTERFGVDGTATAANRGLGPASPASARARSRATGSRYLLAYRPGGPTVTLELDRERFPEVGYDAVVLGVDPDAVELAVDSKPAA